MSLHRISLFSVLFVLALGAQAQAPAPPQVSAAGVGELRLPPERATLVLVVETADNDAAVAGEDNARHVARLRRGLEKYGLSPEAVQNVGYSLRDERRADERKEGPWFVARNSLRVELADVNAVGKVIDAALAAGANEVASVAFHVADEAGAKHKALALAVEQARALAETMAAAAGGGLGDLIEVSYANGGPRPYMEMAMARGAAATDVSRSEIVVTERVLARWRFVPGKK